MTSIRICENFGKHLNQLQANQPCVYTKFTAGGQKTTDIKNKS